MFFSFHQNNSGGFFKIDNDKGIDAYVIVEGDTVEEVMDKAEKIGLYFDGAGDCSCCGNRWSEYGHLTNEPEIYGNKLNLDIIPYDHENKRFSDNNGWIHYKDGTKRKFGIPGL